MLEIGIKGIKEISVTEAMSAKEVGSGELDVFATPALLILVEETIWQSVASELEKDESTVGVKVDLSHISATPIGMKVKCESELIEIDRRKLVFSFTVYDERNKIAEGVHERFIVKKDKFLEKVYG